MIKIAIVFLLVGFTSVLTDDSSCYKNYRVYDVVENGAYTPRLRTLDDGQKLEVLKEYHTFDEGSEPKTYRSYLVPPHKEKSFLKVLDIVGAEYNISVPDLGERIQEERRSLGASTRRSQTGPSLQTDVYYSYDQIEEYIKYISKVKPPKAKEPIAKVEKIGKTFEGRDMYLIKISTDPDEEKPIIFFEAGIHAREWMAPAAALYMIHQLVENFTATGDVLDKIDFYIIPVSNPDGYEYSRSTNRLWRKTRSEWNGIYGVDGNRNFDYHWGERGTSNDPNSDIYKGPYPFSEVETRNIRDTGKKYADRIRSFVSIHAYGPHILYPWGYVKTPAPKTQSMDKIARAAAKTIQKISGTKYQVGPSSVLMYEAAGGSDDYFKGVLGVDLTYTVELSSAGEKSFIVPPNKILGIVSEAFEGFKVIAEQVSQYQKEKVSGKVAEKPSGYYDY